MRKNSSSGSDKGSDRKSFDKRTSSRPASGSKKPFSREKKTDEDRPKRSFDRDSTDRPKRSFDNEGERPKRSFSKDSSDRPKRNFDSDRPKRTFDKDGEKPKRSFDRDSTDRPKRSFDKPFNKDRKFDSDRPKRSFDKDGDKPKRSFDRDSTDRPKRSFDKPFNKDRKFDSDRPKRTFDKDGERPKRSFDRDSTDRPKRSFDKDGDRPKRPYAKRTDSDKPSRFDDKKDSKFKKDDRPESKKPFSERNIFKEDKPARPVEDYEKNFVTPKEFTKSLEDKKPVLKKGEKSEDFDKPFPLGSRKVSGPFRKNDAEKFEVEKKEYFEKKAAKKKRPEYDEDGEEIPDEVAEVKDMTLNKYIAHSGKCSRREAAEMVKQGKVKVNGELALDPGYRVQEFDEVTIAGKKLTPQKGRVYVLLNKPKGYITTTDDPQGRDTVMDLVDGVDAERLYPVGRLDRNTTGLLLLTNDGDLAQRLSHPSYETKKVYQVTLNKPLTKKDFDAIVEGLTLEDGPVQVDELSYLDEKTELGIEIHSGRNRIVRRIFESLGYEVEKLDRVMYAGLTKKNLPRGKWRLLVEKEIILLKHFKI